MIEVKKLAAVYSPHPMLAYRLAGVPQDGVTTLLGWGKGDAAWNLFWLSTPSLDLVPGTGPAWFKVYKIQTDLLASIVRDVSNDEVLYRKLRMHPSAFAEWFERQNHTRFRTFLVAGGTSWVPTVMHRCAMAEDRMLMDDPPIQVSGKVVSILGKRIA